METWKQAGWLAWFEIKASKKSLLFIIFMFMVNLFSFVSALKSYLETDFVLYDILFLIAFGIIVIWTKPKELQYQKVTDDFWVNPYFVFLHQLPIPRKVLIRSRFLHYYLLSIPFHLLLLVFLYVLSEDMNNLLSVGEYIAFSLVWLSWGIAFGSIYPASDSGDLIKPFPLIIMFILLCLAFFAVPYFLYNMTMHGIVFWTIKAAENEPFITGVLSIIVAVASMFYWPRYMSRNMEKMDYIK